MAHARHLSTRTVTELRDGWNIYVTAPGAVIEPSGLQPLSAAAAVLGAVPGTVVSALQQAGSSILKHEAPDDFDVWYACVFDAEVPNTPEVAHLVFEGLATIADVWLNGEHVLHSENMYLRHEVSVNNILRPQNELCIRFSSLNRFLEQRRPRPQWRTNIVDHQQLRWVRTSLIGRMPGWHQWASRIHAVGPWRPVSLVVNRVLQCEDADIRASVAPEEGSDGIVRAQIRVRLLDPTEQVTEAFLHVGEHTVKLSVNPEKEGTISLTGALRIPGVERWWPHTHGEQPLYPVGVHITPTDVPAVVIDFGPTGFRSVSLDQEKGNFSVAVNAQRIFCRGACWTTTNPLTLAAKEEEYKAPLELARDAGMNMMRNPGNGFYEADYFYDRCAALGILLWQDFAFAVMDYPSQDADFRASVEQEARQLLNRLQLNPALTVLCGNSECEAAAAMHSLSADQWENPLFTQLLPQASRDLCPDVPFVRSSQWGGALPFHVNMGVSHYYGIGAYLRPLDDARRSGVRFATECLGIAHIPEEETTDVILAAGESPGHHPSWKVGVPRTIPGGWDSDDVRDHYTRLLFGEDPAVAMYSDSERYLSLGRMTSGEVVTSAFSEWRRAESSCNGALLWFYQDLWPCAGWGIIDSFGRPKPVYYYLKRALSPLSVFFSDEGMSGLQVHVVNEQPFAVDISLRIALYRHGQTCVHQQKLPLRIEARGFIDRSVDELIGHFMDTTYAYRFGPVGQDVTVAALEEVSRGAASAPAFYFPGGLLRFPSSGDIGLQAQARPRKSGDGKYDLTLRATRFAQAVRIDVRGYRAEDNYFHLEPGREYSVGITPVSWPAKALSGHVAAFNTFSPTKIVVLPNEAAEEAMA